MASIKRMSTTRVDTSGFMRGSRPGLPGSYIFVMKLGYAGSTIRVNDAHFKNPNRG
jgi:hypothetical protein